MMEVKYIFRAVVVLAFSSTQLFAGGLSFEKVVIDDVIAPGEKSYPFEFAFENTGDATVEISEIKTTCGCTTAKLDKMNYAPGEFGVITGTFSVGSRQGMQEKKVRVMTKDLAQPTGHYRHGFFEQFVRDFFAGVYDSAGPVAFADVESGELYEDPDESIQSELLAIFPNDTLREAWRDVHAF